MKGTQAIPANGEIHPRRVCLPEKPAVRRERKGIRMLRWLIFLTLCLFLQDLHWKAEEELSGEGPVQEVRITEPLVGPALMRQDLLASLASSPCQVFPANLPWAVMRKVALHRDQIIEEILRDEPAGAIKFLQMSLERYNREVKGYSCILIKKERVEGKIRVLEKTECYFREKPFSVYMNFLAGVGEAQRVLYVQGENNGKMLARPSGLPGPLGALPFDVESPKARKAGRYLITEFGIKLGSERTLKAMLSAQGRKVLHVRYDGIFRVPEVGDRLCYKIVRTPYEPLEDEGVYELTLYFDVETWLQVGSILKGPNDYFIAEYFFRDVRINPTFKDNQFKKSAL
jgi:uncharacterized protein DUF1571